MDKRCHKYTGSILRMTLLIIFFYLYIVLLRINFIKEIIENKAYVSLGWGWNQVFTALSDERMLLIIPIEAVLPYAASFIDEYKSGYMRFILIRRSKRQYVLAKVIAVYISGALTLGLGVFMSFIFSNIMFFGVENRGVENLFLNSGSNLSVPVMIYMSLGGMYALLGLYLSVLTGDRFVSWAGPFTFEYILRVFSKRFMKGIFVIDPGMWIDFSVQKNGIYILAWVLAVSVMLILLFVRSALERLSNY